MNDAAERRRGATMFSRLLRDAEFREDLRRIGYVRDKPVILLLDDDTLGEVMGRIVDANPEPPAVLAMYRESANVMVLWSLQSRGRHATVDVTDPFTAQTAATIGMLYDTMAAAGRSTCDVELRWPSPGAATLSMHEAVPAG